MSRLLMALVLLMILSLVGCGGGGSAPAEPSTDWQAKYQRLSNDIASTNQELTQELSKAQRGEASWKAWVVIVGLLAMAIGASVGSRARSDAEPERRT